MMTEVSECITRLEDVHKALQVASAKYHQGFRPGIIDDRFRKSINALDELFAAFSEWQAADV